MEKTDYNPLRTALVTGAAGFLGRHVCTALQQTGWHVAGIERPGSPQVPYLDAVYTSPTAAAQALPTPGAVLHLAAVVPYGNMDQPDPALWHTNVGLVETLVGLFPAARHVLASSVSVYGQASGEITETTPLVAPNLYGLSKVAAEACVRLCAAQYAILRFTSLWGPGMKPAGFLPLMHRQAQAGGPLTLWGEGTRQQDYLHVEDAAGWCAAAAASPHNGVFLAANGTPHTNHQVALAVAAHYAQQGLRLEITFQGTDTTPSTYYNPRHSCSVLNFAPRLGLLEALPGWLHHYSPSKTQ